MFCCHARHSAVLALVFSLNAAAADEQPMEEIVVTAGFRDAALMSSAGSVSVVDAKAVAERAARHLEHTLAAIPNVNFSVGGSRARFVQMRGVGDLEQFVDPKHFQSVGIVLDGIELSNIASGALLFDTEQIEVLRGPQGTRFGASALAGLININSRDPGESFTGEITSGYGNLDTWHVTAAAGGPLSESLGARFAVRQLKSDGFIDNVFLGRDDTQDQDELAARGKVVWTLLPGWEADLTALYVDQDNGYDAFSLDNSRRTLSDEPGTDAQEAAAVGLGLGGDTGRFGRVEIRGTYTDADETYGFDEDWVFSGFCDGVRCPPAFEFASSDTMKREREQATADVRWLADAGRLVWVLGAYYHHRDEDLARERFGLFESTYETNRYALYGQFEWTFNEALRARLGIRGEAFDDDYSDTFAVETQSNDTSWSGEATLEYEPRERTLLYTTFSRGAKPGGVNTGATSVQPFVATRFQPFIDGRSRFDTETLFNKEIGLKGRYLDNRLALRLSAFHMERSNAQLESWLWDATTFVFVGMLDNVDDAENYGVELEADVQLLPSLALTTRVGYLETNIESMTVFDLDLDDFRQLRDRDQAKAPRWQYHFALDWAIRSNLHANISVEGRDENFFGYYHDQKLDAYAVMNAALSWQVRGVELSVWGRNLLNTQYDVHGLYFANDPRDGFAINRRYLQRGEPRVYGFDLRWAF